MITLFLPRHTSRCRSWRTFVTSASRRSSTTSSDRRKTNSTPSTNSSTPWRSTILRKLGRSPSTWLIENFRCSVVSPISKALTLLSHPSGWNSLQLLCLNVARLSKRLHSRLQRHLTKVWKGFVETVTLSLCENYFRNRSCGWCPCTTLIGHLRFDSRHNTKWHLAMLMLLSVSIACYLLESVLPLSNPKYFPVSYVYRFRLLEDAGLSCKATKMLNDSYYHAIGSIIQA